MTDLHTHILPNMDDGSSSIEESIEMLKSLAEQGVDKVVLTSHFYAENETPDEYLARRAKAYEELKKAMEGRDDLPRVLLGAEVCYYIGISRMENIERFCIEGSPLLIVEPPLFCTWDRGVIDEILALCNSGKAIIVIAHINRYFIYNKIDVFEEFIRAGALMQVNTEVVSERRQMRMLKKFDKREMFHFLGTDCHNMEGRKPIYRDAVQRLEKFLGPMTFVRLDYYEQTFIS